MGLLLMSLMLLLFLSLSSLLLLLSLLLSSSSFSLFLSLLLLLLSLLMLFVAFLPARYSSPPCHLVVCGPMRDSRAERCWLTHKPRDASRASAAFFRLAASWQVRTTAR